MTAGLGEQYTGEGLYYRAVYHQSAKECRYLSGREYGLWRYKYYLALLPNVHSRY
jgi:hypothetical protein